MKQKSPTMLIIALSCLAIIAYAGFMNHLFNNHPTPSPLPSTYPSQYGTPGWKIYTNTKYNFSFKFPGNLGYQGAISGPTTGTVVSLRSFADSSTVHQGTNDHFDGFSVYVVTNPGTTFNKYIDKEIVAMNVAKFTGMKNPTKLELANGVALISQDQGQAYYYLPTKDQKMIVVFAYLQADSSFKQSFDKTLASFKFTNE